MTTAELGVAGALVDAIVGRDFARAVALLHPEIDFRAMTPNRVWEADGPAGVEAVLREWLDDPNEDVEAIEATEPISIEDTVRVVYYVGDASYVDEVVAAVGAVFKDIKPAASMLIVKMIEEAMKIEIEVTARIGASRS